MMSRSVLLATVLLLAAACAVGPNYKRPSVPVPPAYKEASTASADTSQWKTAEPRDEAARGKWWTAFGDPQLDALEEQVTVSNQTIAQAEAQFRFARAGVRLARASLLPTVSASASAGQSSGVTNRAAAAPNAAAPAITALQPSAALSWELDVFGRIRRTVESGIANAQASAADLEAVRLAIHAELAIDYFMLRGLDAQRQLLDSTVAAYATALQITTNRYKQGVVSGVDVAQARAQLETTRAQAIDLGVARAQVEHAIAVLVGRPPADFTLAPEPMHDAPPTPPLDLPSELLERRPDVAAAERRVAAANAGIGVARAAYFPTLVLSGSGGYEASALSGLFSLPNRFWSLGSTLAETLFAGGKRRAVSAQARASYDAAVAAYRESVLSAFADVEDNLAALRILAEETQQQTQAVDATDRLLALAKNRYQSGVTSYLEVMTAQSAALANERTAVDLLTRRMTASVNLVKALGGGWRVSDLPYGGVPTAQGATAPPARPVPDRSITAPPANP
jgi:NodT family efflux transporter outer membrane factor (OMF) lipoprotein